MRYERLLLLGFFLMSGCGAARVAEEQGPKVYRALSVALRGAQLWAPNYVATGLSTGIMISPASGSGSRLTLDVWRYPIDTTAAVVIEAVADAAANGRTEDRPVGYLEIHTPLVVLSSPVNDLGQAFFKVPPGTYLLHPRIARAPNLYVTNVEVQEGTYAIVPLRLEGATTLERALPREVRN